MIKIITSPERSVCVPDFLCSIYNKKGEKDKKYSLTFFAFHGIILIVAPIYGVTPCSERCGAKVQKEVLKDGS